MKSHRYYILGLGILFMGLVLYNPLFNDPRPKTFSPDFSSSLIDKDIAIRISNIRLADWFPRWKIMMVNICVDNPYHNTLRLNGKIIYSEDEKELLHIYSETSNPACEDIYLYFPTDADLTQVEISISSVQSWPNRNETIDGSWDFHIRREDMQDYVVLTLLDPDTPSPIQQDIDLRASDMRKFVPPPTTIEDISALQIDICLLTPSQSKWGIWHAILEYGDGESVKHFFMFDENVFEIKSDGNCKILGFEIPSDAEISKAHLKIFGVLLPPDISSEEECNKYLPHLQEAINDRYFGMVIKCIRSNNEGRLWGINYTIKPPWMSAFDAGTLIGSYELYTVKGNWEFDLVANP